MELAAFLLWLVTYGAGPIAFAIIQWVPWAWMQNLAPKAKRVFAFGLSAVIAIGGFFAEIAMQYEQAPGAWPAEWRLWVGKLFLVGTAAFGLATLVHTTKLKDTPDS